MILYFLLKLRATQLDCTQNDQSIMENFLYNYATKIKQDIWFRKIVYSWE